MKKKEKVMKQKKIKISNTTLFVYKSNKTAQGATAVTTTTGLCAVI